MLTNEQVVHSMIAYVKNNLMLANMGDSQTDYSHIFEGNGIRSGLKKTHFSLDVITDVSTIENTGLQSYLQSRIDRASPGNRVGFIFPRAIDYDRAKKRYEGPFLRQARLLGTIKETVEDIVAYMIGDKSVTAEEIEEIKGIFNAATTRQAFGRAQKLYQELGDYEREKYKILTRAEWETVIPFQGSFILYYNPSSRSIEVCRFSKVPSSKGIPDERPLVQGYLWDFLRFNPPEEGDSSRKAEIYRQIQQGLHDHIRQMMLGDNIIRGGFTLIPAGRKGLKAAKEQRQLLLI